MPEAKKPRAAVRVWPQVRVFRELLRANSWVTQQARAFVEAETGLGMSEFDMVVELGNQPHVRMSDLAKRMVVSAPNVTRVAQSLTAKGLVVRQRAEHSDREVLARLTPEGEALFHRHFPRAAAFMATLMDGQLTRKEQVQLGELLAKIGGAKVSG